MVKTEDVLCGWKFMERMLASNSATYNANADFLSNERFKQINDAIEELAKNINEHPHVNLGIEQLKGYIAEEWHAGTFNVDALRKGSDHRAWTLQENGYGSVDVKTNFGKDYSLKYSNTANSTENMQAALNIDTKMPKYHNQERLIAIEQVEEAREIAQRRGLKELVNRPSVAESHFESKEHLVGRIEDGNGVSSNELTIKESKNIAKDAKESSFNPENYGIQKEIEINYFNNALKAGLTAAAITGIMKIVPELYKAIDYLIKNGEIDIVSIKKSGNMVISAGAEAFLRGSLAYGVEVAIQQGMLGEAPKLLLPATVGAAVTVILETVKNSILIANGKISASEMGMRFVDSVSISAGYLAGMKVGGVIAQTLLPELPIVGYALGSLLGCTVAIAYNIGKKSFLSFCVDTGFTCFGLVDQDYSIPESVLNQIGIDTIQIPQTDIADVNIDNIDVAVNVIDIVEYETINFIVLKRGILGVNKIGYIW